MRNSFARSQNPQRSNYLGVESIFNNELSEEYLYDIKPFSHKKLTNNMYDFYLDNEKN